MKDWCKHLRWNAKFEAYTLTTCKRQPQGMLRPLMAILSTISGQKRSGT